MSRFRATRVLELIIDLQPDDLIDGEMDRDAATEVADSTPESAWTIVQQEVNEVR